MNNTKMKAVTVIKGSVSPEQWKALIDLTAAISPQEIEIRTAPEGLFARMVGSNGHDTWSFAVVIEASGMAQTIGHAKESSRRGVTTFKQYMDQWSRAQEETLAIPF